MPGAKGDNYRSMANWAALRLVLGPAQSFEATLGADLLMGAASMNCRCRSCRLLAW
jgi:hypothetical protein